MIIACLHAAASANQTSNGTRIKQNKHIQKLIAFIVVDVLLASSLEFLVGNFRLFIHFKVLFASSVKWKKTHTLNLRFILEKPEYETPQQYPMKYENSCNYDVFKWNSINKRTDLK